MPKLDIELDIGSSATPDVIKAIPVQKMQAERIRVLYRQASFVLVGNFLVAAILGTFVYQFTQDIRAWYWVFFVAVLTLFRYWLVVRFYKRERGEKDTIRWGWYFAVTAFISGCSWGVTSIMFLDPGNATLLVFLLMTLTGTVVASSAVLSNFVWSYYAFAIPAITPFGYMLVSTGETGFAELGVMLMVFLALQLIVSKKNQNTLDNSILLRNENADLIQELRVKNTKLESANSAKTKFLAAASHDLRQPLHALGLFVDALGERIDDADQTRIIGKIRKSKDSLGELMDSLLDISKLDAGVIRAKLASFSVQKLFDILNEEFSPMSDEKGVALIFMNTSLWANSDEKIVAQILRNLISNAIRYTSHGKVLVGCRRTADTITLFVGDTGIGIDPDNMEIIFEEFRQLGNNSRDRSKGLGLGLSIVRRMANLLSADVAVRSIPGRGSLFSVKLPRCQPGEIDQPQPQLFNAQASLAGKLFVIIEDEVEIRNALKLLLAGWGGKVLEGASFDDLKLQLEQTENPDMILADYRLAGNQNGIDVIHAIHDYCGDKTIPASIITGDTAPERIREVNDCGFLIMHKPVSGGKLRATLNSLMLLK